MKLVTLPISEIHPYENNSRVHPQEQLEKLAASIRAFGIAKPILLDEKHMILAGHGVYKAAQLAEETEIPCVINDTLTDEQKRAYIIADNRLTDLSYFDMEIVTAEAEKLLQADYSVDMTGFDMSTLFPEDVNMDDFFESAAEREKKSKTVTCPHCGETFEV